MNEIKMVQGLSNRRVRFKTQTDDRPSPYYQNDPYKYKVIAGEE